MKLFRYIGCLRDLPWTALGLVSHLFRDMNPRLSQEGMWKVGNHIPQILRGGGPSSVDPASLDKLTNPNPGDIRLFSLGQ